MLVQRGLSRCRVKETEGEDFNKDILLKKKDYPPEGGEKTGLPDPF